MSGGDLGLLADPSQSEWWAFGLQLAQVSGGNLGSKVAQVSGGNLGYRAQVSGGNLGQDAQVSGGSIFNYATMINNASFFDGAKIYGGDIFPMVGLKLFNVIFKASFNCPADIPDDIQSMKIASPQTAFDRAWNTRIDDIQGKANTVTWPNCQAEGCFYEDGLKQF